MPISGPNRREMTKSQAKKRMAEVSAKLRRLWMNEYIKTQELTTMEAQLEKALRRLG